MATKTTTKSRSTAGSQSAAGSGKQKWSADVTKNSNALDLDKGVFTKGSPTKIAHSLERSADKSTRKKSDSYRSAMSMLTFYINRAGKNLPESKKKILQKAKEILREDHAQANAKGGTKAAAQPRTKAK
jgi:hypothetical protein